MEMNRCLSCFESYDAAYAICPHCGSVANPEPKEPIHLVPGTLLAGRYLLGEAVGAGGFGIVYKAWDTKLETVVAVKEFFMSRLMTRAPGTGSVIITKKSQVEFAYRKERFLAEARNMAKFGSHRSIPNVFEFFEDNGTAYIVMELLHGQALNQYLKQVGNILDTDFAIMIAGEVGGALRSLHEKGIIHRDVAPDNIFIASGKELRIKLMDLGAAKLADSTDENIDIVLKPGYSPTEQYDNSKSIGPWTDIYALGATLYRMLTGVKPDESTNRKISDEVVPPNQLNPGISENLSNTIMKAMAVDKHMRFKTVDEFLQALSGERKVCSLAQERRRRGLRRGISVAAACLVVLGVFGVAAGSYLSKKAKEDLKPATITVWYGVSQGSTEKAAMQAVAEDFNQKFPKVELQLQAFDQEEYADALQDAAAKGQLPDLFESTGAPQSVLEKARDLDEVIGSAQWADCLFLDQYSNYYTHKKQVPLAIEVPMAYVITKGAASVDYTDATFAGLSAFPEGTAIAWDPSHSRLLEKNFGSYAYAEKSTFLDNTANTSPVMVSTSMGLNEFRQTLTNYAKTCVVYSADQIYCGFTYEWSIASTQEAEFAAAQRLLSWMLGNVYQSTLMISQCNDGQIPVNATSFHSKVESKYLSAMEQVYEHFVFEKEE